MRFVIRKDSAQRNAFSINITPENNMKSKENMIYTNEGGRFMKKAKILSAFLSFTLGMTQFAVTPITAIAEENTETAVTETELDENMIYGDIRSEIFASTYEMYTGDKLNLSEMSLNLTTYTDSNSDHPSIGIYNCSFTVGSGLYSDLYTLDTSQVDTTKAGIYRVIVMPKAGEVGTFTTKNNKSLTNPGYIPPDGNYDICMKGNKSYITVKVYDKEKVKDTPFYMHFYTEYIDVPLNNGVQIELVGALASDVTYEVEDETIAKVNEAKSSNKYLVLQALKEGETTVKATTSDGRTVTEKVRVLPPSPVKQGDPLDSPDQTTTTKASGGTTTSTTTVTVSTVSKWWYDFETTTAAYSSINTNTTTAVTKEPVITTTAIFDYLPIVEYDKSPMKIGETRTIKFYHPEDPDAKGKYVGTVTDCVSIDYINGENTFKVTALKEGKAQIYITCEGCPFSEDIYIDIIAAETLKGDANCDGNVDMSDAVLIMQSIANPSKYKLTDQGSKNADMDGDGVTNADALAIQKKLLKLE